MNNSKVGQTPLIEITSLGLFGKNRVFAKCENLNPLSHSHYDRVYARLFDLLMKDEKTRPENVHLYESSSGNAGTAFARYCDLYGYKGTVIFPNNVRENRLKSINSPNVEVVVSDKKGFMLGAKKTMISLANQRKKAGENIWIVNHSQSWESVVAVKPIATESICQFDMLGIKLNYFISALGNGTSTSGIGMELKKYYKGIKVVGFEPKSAPVYSVKFNKFKQTEMKDHVLTGTGVWGIPFPNMLETVLSDIVVVDDDQAAQNTWKAISEDVSQLFNQSIGLTSAASIATVQALAQKTVNQNYLVIFYDINEYY